MPSLLDYAMQNAFKKAKAEKRADNKRLKDLHYDIDNLFCDVNETFEKMDEGQITKKLAYKKMRVFCKKFLVKNKTSATIDVYKW